jgi:hypothetical protein
MISSLSHLNGKKVQSFPPQTQISSDSMGETTEDRSVKALSQMLYGQYHFWELFGSYIYVLDLKTKVLILGSGGHLISYYSNSALQMFTGHYGVSVGFPCTIYGKRL